MSHAASVTDLRVTTLQAQLVHAGIPAVKAFVMARDAVAASDDETHAKLRAQVSAFELEEKRLAEVAAANAAQLESLRLADVAQHGLATDLRITALQAQLEAAGIPAAKAISMAQDAFATASSTDDLNTQTWMVEQHARMEEKRLADLEEKRQMECACNCFVLRMRTCT
jgi:hypothetical protein